MPDKQIINTISTYYPLQILKAYNNNEQSIKALEVIAKSLTDIYRYFEPSFFKGEFYVIKHFTDAVILDESRGTPIYFSHEKNELFNQKSNVLIVQVFDSNKIIIWENESPANFKNRDDALIYFFQNNKETFFANASTIDVTEYPVGSRFASQFSELAEALKSYAINNIYQSSCDKFSESWVQTDPKNRIFFQGGGRGSNMPEKFMQESLYNFLRTIFSRGIKIDTKREFNTLGTGTKPKPCDVTIQWKKDNRLALIEVKFLGTVKGTDGQISYTHDNARANEGITQLKGYHDAAATDLPTTIIKSYLIVIDGRRNNLKNETVSISFADGMHFKDVDVTIDADKKHHETIPGFEKPIKMFAAPKCT